MPPPPTRSWLAQAGSWWASSREARGAPGRKTDVPLLESGWAPCWETGEALSLETGGTLARKLTAELLSFSVKLVDAQTEG